ncbi:hypothetical protein G9464_12390 [Halostella sp. JP-L12]|uniref:hypothetical protein n=1 Tax=Halostella TaxID=1843185 RepID=UPI000EF7A37A|nr:MULTISPECIES: hypothetical protein [Halostella]NHN48387.1 hypothetical protein [Halostella sp. JP-L12]
MPIIRFETADRDDRTQIGEGLVRFAVEADRLVTGQKEGKYFLRHGDGCAVCDEAVAAGDSFFFDADAGEILCERHGRERRAGEAEG